MVVLTFLGQNCPKLNAYRTPRGKCQLNSRRKNQPLSEFKRVFQDTLAINLKKLAHFFPHAIYRPSGPSAAFHLFLFLKPSRFV